jgi:acetyl-CoA C-acetyltransferase
MKRLPPVFVLGGYQTDFARHWAREDKGLADMLRESVEGALSDAGLTEAEIETAHVGNFVAGLFTGQSHLAGLLAEAVPGLRGIPVSRHEAACASGSMAVLAAMADLQSGRYDVALVCGLEMMRNVAGDLAAAHLAAASHVGHEAQQARYCWPHLFSSLSAEYDRRYGLDYRYLGRIAEINVGNARDNPLAQTRRWRYEPDAFTAREDLNPVIDGWIRRNDCGQVTDGAACVILANEEGLRRLQGTAGQRRACAAILGFGHVTARMGMSAKFADAAADGLLLPHVRKAFDQALTRAGVGDVFGLDALEVHDCFAITEYMAIEHTGMTAPGEAWRAIEAGWIERGGRLPVNPSGGLIGLGHPVGATGVRMIRDAARQVDGKAGDCQVDNARRLATLNIGGSTTSVAAFVVGHA